LGLNPDAALVIGTKISPHQISISVANFVGEVLASQVIEVNVNQEQPERVADLIEERLRAAIAPLNLAMSDMAGLGIGVPGMIDHLTGVVHWSPVFGSESVPFGDLMRQRLGVPVHIDNDANLVTLAEHWFGQARGLRDFIVVTVESGVGMGAVIGDEIYRGHRGYGCEFGHTKIERNGALCRCGQRGCVEAYVAEYAIVRAAGAFMDVPDMSDPAALHRCMDDLVTKARSGDSRVVQLFETAGEALGYGLANLVNLINPPLIILSGSGVAHYDLYEKAFRKALKDNALSPTQQDTPIKIGSWDEKVWARGAAALVLQALYQAPFARPIVQAAG
jgi:predicted NBD/HSP70 family sugar kinase